MIDPHRYFSEELEAHKSVMDAVRETMAEPFVRMLDVWTTAIENGNKIVFFGNGGSVHLLHALLHRLIFL